MARDGIVDAKVVGGAPVCKLNASIGAAAVSEGVLNQWIDNAAAIEDLVNVVRANYPFSREGEGSDKRGPRFLVFFLQSRHATVKN